MSSLSRSNTFVMSNNVDGHSKLNRLRYHLAVEGCSDSQLSLAKSFLNDATETDAERKENAELAVRWLLLASSEGNHEALKLLENCYKMGVGVTKGNRDNIESCLQSTIQEKLSQRIGCSLFRLVAYDTQESIPLEYFQKRISLYLKEEVVTEKHNLNVTNYNSEKSVYISAKEVVTSVHDCLLGRCPVIRLDCLFNIFHYDFEDDSNDKFVFKRYWNWIFITFLGSIEMFCVKLTEIPLCLTAINFIIITFIMSIFIPKWYLNHNHETIASFLEGAFAFYSFMLMSVTFARVIRCDNNVINIQKWTQVIARFDKKAAEIIPPWRYCESLFKFFLFLLGLTIFVSSETQLGPITAFGNCVFIFYFITKLIMEPFHKVPCIFLIINLVLAFSIFLKKCDSSTWAFGNIFSVALPLTNQSLIVRPVAALSLASAVVGLLMLFCYNFRSCVGILVCVLWMQLITRSFVNFESISWNFVLICFLFLLNKRISIHSCLFLIFLMNTIMFRSSIVSFTGSSALLLSVSLAERFIAAKKNSYTVFSQIYFLLMLMTTLSAVILLPSFVSVFNNKGGENLTWTNYSRLCHRHAWSETNIALTQINCEKFQGSVLIFEANVNNVYRKYSYAFNVPSLLGIKFIDAFAVNYYEVTMHIKGTFRIEAEMHVQTDDKCKDFVFDLRTGDLLSVTGTLVEGLGTEKPTLILQSAQCISCMDEVACHVERVSWNQVFVQKLAKVLAFFLYPWIE